MSHLDVRQEQLFWSFIQLVNEDFDSTDQADWMQTLLTTLLGSNVFRGSVLQSPNIDQERAAGHQRLLKDYFRENPTYPPHIFCRRFRMGISLFQRTKSVVALSNDYFQQRIDVVGVLGLMSLQSIIATMRMMAYDKSADNVDEYVRMGESTSLQCLKEFCKIVIHVFGPQYLRHPKTADMDQILRHSAHRGFPGMMGSLDCMHWSWKNCLRAWVGQFGDRSGEKSVILEAVATYDLWSWHSNFGTPGSNNDVDINVLDHSPLFNDFLKGIAPTATFTVHNQLFHQCYNYLTDGSYPKWAVFMQSITNPLSEKRKYFAMRQEVARKDIERAFGVLRGRWSILKNPARLWQRSTLHQVIYHSLHHPPQHDCGG